MHRGLQRPERSGYDDPEADEEPTDAPATAAPAASCADLTAKDCRAASDCTYSKASKTCDDKGRRDRRSAHGSSCVNVFANDICATTFGTRQRRAGHGMSAVCMAIKASRSRMLLFEEGLAEELELTFSEDATMADRCTGVFHMTSIIASRCEASAASGASIGPNHA